MPSEVAALSSNLYGRFSTDGRLNLGATGGLGSRDLGQLTFELSRRGMMSFGAPGAGDTILGGTGLGTQQVANMEAQLTKASSVLGIVKDMLGPNTPFSTLVQAVEAISGQSVGAVAINPERVRQQLQNAQGLAQVTRTLPSSLLAMGAFGAQQFQAMGLPSAQGFEVAISQHAAIREAEAMAALVPGADISRAALARAGPMRT